MKVLVTGGTGFVGCNIVRVLAEQGLEVVAFDTASPDAMLERFWEPVSGSIAFVQGDVTNADALTSLLEREHIGAVVHAAAITTGADGDPNALARLLRVNLQGSVTVLDVARATRSVNRFVFISSAAVYGESPEGSAVSEDASIKTDLAYGQAKYAIEAAVRYAHLEDTFTTASLRLGWIYGPMERPTSSRSRMSEIWQLCHCARLEGAIRINDLSAERDWAYAEDVGQAVYALLSHPVLPHRVYNLSGGKGVGTEEVVNLLVQRMPHLTVTTGSKDETNIWVNVQNRRGYLDIQRLRDDLGFNPQHTMSDGLDAYLTWLQETGDV